MARLDETKDGYNEWFDAAYDYADANLNLNPRILASPAFERAARQAFDAGQDPYSFMSEYMAGEAAFRMGDMEESAGDADPGREGTCQYCGEDAYCACEKGPNTEGGGSFDEFLHMAQNHADDIGIKQRVWSSPGFEQAAKKWFDSGDDDWAMFAQDYQRESKARMYGKMESVSLQELFGDRTDDEDHKSSGRKAIPPDYKEKAQQYKASGEEVAPNKKSKKMSEAHGQNAGHHRGPGEKIFNQDRVANKDSRRTIDPKLDFGNEPDETSWGEPDDQYLTGPDTGRGEFDDMGGFHAGDEDEEGFEDPTSSKHPEGFYDIPEPSVDPEDDMWHGTDVEPEDVPGQWDAKGMPRNPDDDVKLDSQYDDEDDFSAKWSHYWDDRARAKAQDDRFEPIRQRHGNPSRGLNARRQPKKEGMKQDRKHAADAYHADQRARGDERSHRREPEAEFEPDESGELKQSNRD